MHPFFSASLLAVLAAPAFASPIEQVEVIAAPITDNNDTPRTIISAADIARSGATSLDELLEQLPALGAQGVNGNQNAGGYGEAFADLRNLNFNRTLVLVDGRRMVVSGIRTDEAVDLNSIPVALVEHIEIRADGSQPDAAIDAVAGLVNVVLKKQVESVHTELYAGAAGAGDDGTFSGSVVAGHSWDRGHVVASLDVFDKRPIPQADRSWAAGPITDAAFDASGGIVTQSGSPATPGSQAVGAGVDSLALGGDQFRPFNAATDQYNFAGAQDLQGGLQRGTGTVSADIDIWDGVSGFIQGIGTIRRATNLQPAEMLGLSGTGKYPNGFVIPATNALNPFGTDVALERAVTEAGPLATTSTGDTWRLVAGLDGNLGSGTWTVSVNHGQTRNDYATANSVNLTRALQSLDLGANWFGPNSLSPTTIGSIAYTDRSHSVYNEAIVQAGLQHHFFALPGGPASLQAGIEARWEHGLSTVSPVTAAGDQAGPDSAPTSGGYATREGFLDLSLPFLKSTEWAHELAASLSVRGTNTDRYGNLLASRAAFDYAPTPDIKFRGSVGTSRRPPAITEAFAGLTADLLPVTDPCDPRSGLRSNPVVDANCRKLGLSSTFRQTASLIDVPSGGNPSLTPEDSSNQSLGVVLTPTVLPSVTLSADWWHYRVGNAIDSLADTDPNLIPNTCLSSVNLSSPLCSLITRFASGPQAGQISQITARDANVGTIKTSGIDFDLDSSRKFGNFGTLHLEGQASWLLDWRIASISQSGYTQYAGTFPGLVAVGQYARLRGRVETTLNTGPWSFSWTGRFQSGGHVLDDDSPYTHAPALLYQDISVSRQFGTLTWMLGINNILDVAPPRLLDGITNTDTNSYDVVGIFGWTRLSAQF